MRLVKLGSLRKYFNLSLKLGLHKEESLQHYINFQRKVKELYLKLEGLLEIREIMGP